MAEEKNITWEIYKKYGYAIVNTPGKNEEEEQNNNQDLSHSPSRMIHPLPPQKRGCCGRW